MGDKCKGLFTRRVQANILTGIIIALSYVLLQNFSSVRLFLGKFYAIISPIVAGLILAYLLNMIMAPLEKNVLKFVKKSSIKRALSLSLTVIIALVIIAGMLFAIIPQTITSVGSLFVSVQRFLADNKTELMQLAARFNLEEIANIIYGSWNDIFELAKDWGVTALPGVLSATKRVGNGFFNGVMALFIAIYLLADKERLCRHSRIVVRALASDSVYDRTMLAASRSHHIFSGFISGKLLDSLIVGVICFIVMIIFNWPFAVLISVVIGVTNIIPTFGPFIGAIPSMLIIAIENPIQAVYFAIFIFILQQIDGNLLGPLILGDSTGLSAFWVMIAIVLFGALWGITGMIVGVPLVAIVYVFAAEFIGTKLKMRGIDIDSIQCPVPAASSPTNDSNSKSFISRITSSFRKKGDDDQKDQK